MKRLNVYIKNNLEKLQDFFKVLTDVHELEDALVVDKYLEHTAVRDPMVNLTVNQILLIHDLLYRHQNVVCLHHNASAPFSSPMTPTPLSSANHNLNNPKYATLPSSSSFSSTSSSAAHASPSLHVTDPVAKILQKLGPAPAQVSREENISVTITLKTQESEKKRNETIKG